MRHGNTIVLIAVYLIAMAVVYCLYACEVIGRDPFIGGLLVGSALLVVVNRTWFLPAPETE